MSDHLQLGALQTRMNHLAQRDSRWVVFGAGMHQWNTSPVSEEQLAAIETTAGALPEPWRTWLQTVGTGAGPFYGVQPLPEDDVHRLATPFDHTVGEDAPLPGALMLTDHGCGMNDVLVLNGPYRGEVWLDLRESEGPVRPFFPDVLSWLESWLTFAEAEWGIAVFNGPVNNDDPEFQNQVKSSLERLADNEDNPLFRAYPRNADDLQRALAWLLLSNGDMQGAELRMAQAISYSKDPAALSGIWRASVAMIQNDLDTALATIDGSLLVPGIWWAHKKRLLGMRADVLEWLERFDEALAAREALADFDPNDVQANLMMVWIHAHRRDFDAAVSWVRKVADRDDRLQEFPLKRRLMIIAEDVIRALRESSGHPNLADALEDAIDRMAAEDF